MEVTKEKVLNDIEGLRKRMSLFKFMSLMEVLLEERFSDYDYIYPFTNEKLELFFKYLDLNGRILTVTASGDQALYAILNGATKIDCFDKNKIAKYFMELKISAIKTLSYKEFKNFYKIKNLTPTDIIKNPNFLENLSNRHFDKILSQMSKEYAYFFEMLYYYIRSKDIMTNLMINCNFIPSYSGYLQKEKYYELKEKLQDVKDINYYDCDIFDLKNNIGNKKYSSMIFSNITSYFYDDDLNRLLNLLLQMKDNMMLNALVQFGYGSAEPGFQKIGKNRVEKEFVDSHGNVLFDVEEEDKIITFYKN